ncbi:hypothetical protein DQ04_04111030 [Trypanosoma grayi]|uniref:hypothetical protein n=1 Tax=Trypanosoma grayi TaxID=71804 RepID=UPI0004F48592|nr:hypothetical protein DQ04_04111030 [Trypanosoma grayi]KEG10152.1 hypothetical protein DQ04_04111030 [Trypanosoma grayi]
MESALEALMQCRPFTEAERQLLLKGVGCVALEYAEMLLREGAAVKTVLRRTAEHLCLATEAMEQYLCHLPESLPAFAQAQLKLVRLLLILGVEHPRPAVGENPFLEHAIHMVEELLAEISLLSPSGGTENDAALQRAWRWTRARLTSQVLEAHGDILTAQGRHRAAALCLTRSLDEYGTAVSTYYGGGNDDDDGRNADTRLKESVDVVRLRLRVKYAEALTRSGDYVKSVQLLQRLRAEVTPSSGGVPPDTIATVMQALGNALTACHRLQEAQQCYEDVVECLEAGDDDVFRSAAMDRLADIALCCGKVSEAVVYFRHALRLRRRTLGDCHLDTAASHRNLSEALFLHARYTEAEEHADACMRIVMHLYTGATARHLHDDLAGSPERVGRIASGGGLLGVACAHRSPYVQHPLYAAAARRKSECIQLRKKARILGS